VSVGRRFALSAFEERSMAEVLVRFPDLLRTDDGETYSAQACGGPNSRGLWEGWIEFIPAAEGPSLRTARETTQPNRADAVYWATGLTAAYLEGALTRALNPLTRRRPQEAEPEFDGPAEPAIAPSTGTERHAILDPYSVYEKGEAFLRKELRALSSWHLANIIVAYRLSALPHATLEAMDRRELAELIVEGVRESAPAR
jgi:hypothetical protein